MATGGKKPIAIDGSLNGNYTSECSVIDYVMGNPEIISYISSFNVKPFDAIYSDKHCRTVWSLKCSRMRDNINDNNSNKLKISRTHKQMWSDDRSTTFNDNISHDKVNEIISDINNLSIPVHTCVNDIEHLFIDAANSTFGPEYVIELNSKRSCKPKFSKETCKKECI